MDMMGGDGIDKQCRTPEIMADAAYVMLTRDSRSFTGNFVIGMVQNKIENCHHTIIYNDGKNLWFLLIIKQRESFLDEEILKEEGCRDFAQYLAVPGTAEKDLIPDFFLDEVEDPAQVVGAYKGSNKVI